MRLPLTKVYRAFPELDRFSDVECERFVLRADRDYPESKVGAYALGALVIVAIIVMLVVPERILWGLWSQRFASRLAREDVQDIVLVASVFFYAAVFLVGMLMVRDRWLIRTITRRVHQTSCPSCGYSLLGLAVVQDVVVCPECAAPYFLAEHGVTAKDLMAPGHSS
jgi:hypothetical protein